MNHYLFLNKWMCDDAFKVAYRYLSTEVAEVSRPVIILSLIDQAQRVDRPALHQRELWRDHTVLVSHILCNLVET